LTTTTRDAIRVGTITVRFLVEGSTTEGALALFEFGVPSGAKVPGAHSHDTYDETIYGVEGTLSWTVDDTRTEVGQGDVLRIPRGAVHRFDNEAEADARALAVVTPGLLGPDYFREIGALLAAAAGPPDPTALADVMRRHGLTPAG
jgi:quercetin dioxygenase-like cupin family protein